MQVWVYKKTAQEKFPTLKKYSDQAPPSDPHATREVKIDIEYKSAENPDVSVPPDQRTKAYKYGKNYIPIGGAIEDAFKFKPEKGIKLVGIVKVSEIPRYVLNLLVCPFPSLGCSLDESSISNRERTWIFTKYGRDAGITF